LLVAWLCQGVSGLVLKVGPLAKDLSNISRRAPEAPSGRYSFLHAKEGDMEALAMLGQFLVGVGLLLLGLAALWFVSVYNERKG
jgi:hypothetical protein